MIAAAMYNIDLLITSIKRRVILGKPATMMIAIAKHRLLYLRDYETH